MVRSRSFTRSASVIARAAVLALTVLLALPLGSFRADARAGMGFSLGSRGARTFSMPAPTATAPRPAQPILRSETPRPGDAAPNVNAARPRGFGFGSGLMAGLLGAGLFGLFTGGGFGGVGLFQLLLIAGVIVIVLKVLRSRTAGPAFAGLGAAPLGRGDRGVGPAMGNGAGVNGAPLTPAPQDFAAFERTLVEIQNAYGREDLSGLSRLTTAEMLRVFGAQIEDNRRRGQRNDVSDARLLQGDLAEAWREGGSDYATVAMRFSVRDTMIDRANGRVISGEPGRPTEATEVWTFRRQRGEPWLLSAIQQSG